MEDGNAAMPVEALPRAPNRRWHGPRAAIRWAPRDRVHLRATVDTASLPAARGRSPWPRACPPHASSAHPPPRRTLDYRRKAATAAAPARESPEYTPPGATRAHGDREAPGWPHFMAVASEGASSLARAAARAREAPHELADARFARFRAAERRVARIGGALPAATVLAACVLPTAAHAAAVSDEAIGHRKWGVLAVGRGEPRW